MFTREELWALEARVKAEIHDDMNPCWVHAYTELAMAINRLDAMVARSTVSDT